MITGNVKIIRHVVSLILMNSGYLNILCKKYARSGASLILMYHRIIKIPKNEYVEPGMYVTPTAFRKHLDILKRYFKVVPLKELCNRYTNESEKPVCAITFDDGWNDFYKSAYPVLIEYGFPATVFLPTDFIENQKAFWTDRLTRLILANNYNESNLRHVPESIRALMLRCYTEKNIYKLINSLKKYPIEEIESAIGLMENQIMSNIVNKSQFLNWKQIEDISKSNNICFGSHTSGHIILTTTDIANVKEELKKSKNVLIRKKIVSSDYIPFCYPNGNSSDEIAALVKDAGYSCAVTTRRGWNDKKSNLYNLNRVGMHQDVSFSKSVAFGRMIGKR